MREVDNCGLACPQPVINTKRALDEIDSGVVVSIVDNSVAKENVTRFAENTGCKTEVAEQDGKFIITIIKGELTPEQPLEVNQVLEAKPDGNTIYTITTDALGQGPPELGFVLMKSFMVTLKELDPAPMALIFMNTGAKLACEGSHVVKLLGEIQNRGTEMLVCGTCLDYFKIKDRLLVGKVSNMFEIVQKMQTGKVIAIA
ncbi:sulfurtransferase-like selenium metabolism protein YedF [Peptococcaceae bacterium 1198_IL3148]